MKTQNVFAVAVAGGLLMLLTPTTSRATIIGSPHDFQNKAWNVQKVTCKVCHTPHNAKSPQLIPLWNHQTTVAVFTPYSSATMDSTPGQPNSVSKACLSCHDGTVAINNYGDAVSGTDYVTGSALLGTDLSDNHPISMDYDAAATADPFIRPSSTTVAGLGGATIQDAMLFLDTSDSKYKVQCASCHDVHKQKGDSGSSSLLLVLTGAGSELCVTCHDK